MSEQQSPGTEPKQETPEIKKATATEKQFQVELEKVHFSERGKKLSKPNIQFMSVNAFIHFLKNGKLMGWSLKILKEAAELSEPQKKALNVAIDEWNKAQPIEEGNKEKDLTKAKRDNQISKIK